jgi:S-adenosylmethionine:tRNA ribosyltransferase-isomerase
MSNSSTVGASPAPGFSRFRVLFIAFVVPEGMLDLEGGSFLKTIDFDYSLPERLIATVPAPRRDASRLLILSKQSGKRNHSLFSDLPRFLRPRSLLVLNDTQVIPARLMARKPTGGVVEVFLVEPSTDPIAFPPPSSPQVTWRALVRGLGRFPLGGKLLLEGNIFAELIERGEKGACVLRFSGEGFRDVLATAQTIGKIPLPPYIEAARKTRAEILTIDDDERYQTIFAKTPGAVAAPTAGLHFTPELLMHLQAEGHSIVHITLHVGPGTFRPVTTVDPADHHLDSERFEVSQTAATQIEEARRIGRPIVAVGTTVVRTLETLGRRGPIVAGRGRTELMVLPGDSFSVVSDLVTNFHLPRSSLLMLVSAFAGREAVLAAYAEAVEQGYRFYSYGDAMFIRSEEKAC